MSTQMTPSTHTHMWKLMLCQIHCSLIAFSVCVCICVCYMCVLHVCVYLWAADCECRRGEEEQGAQINHLPSGRRVQLSLGDRQQIRGDVQEHLWGQTQGECHGSHDSRVTQIEGLSFLVWMCSAWFLISFQICCNFVSKLPLSYNKVKF